MGNIDPAFTTANSLHTKVPGTFGGYFTSERTEDQFHSQFDYTIGMTAENREPAEKLHRQIGWGILILLLLLRIPYTQRFQEPLGAILQVNVRRISFILNSITL